MKTRAETWLRELDPLRALSWLTMLLLAFTLAGCGNGSDGAQGPAGPQGPQGPAGPVATTTGEACAVCHGAGQEFAVAKYMGPSLFKTDASTPSYDKPDIVVKNIQLTNLIGDPVVTFRVETTDGKAVSGIPSKDFLFMLADLVPAQTTVTDPVVTSGVISSTTTTAYSTSYFEQYAHEAKFDYRGNPTPFGTLVDNGDGTYQYSFLTTFGSITPNVGLNNDEYQRNSGADDQRLAIDISADQATVGGTSGYINAGIGFLDFAGVPSAGNTATPVTNSTGKDVTLRQFVTIQTCEACHGKHMEQAAHANEYPDTRACVLCHSPLYGSSTNPSAHHLKGSILTDGMTLPQYIHQLHAGIDAKDKITQDGRGDSISPRFNWGPNGQKIVFPQEINNCKVCHANPAGQALEDMVVTDSHGQKTPITGSSGVPDTTIDAWKDHPTRQVCATCHYTVRFDGTQFVGLDGKSKRHVTEVNDNLCSGCHSSGNTPPDLAVGNPGGLQYVHNTAPKLVAETKDASGNITSIQDNRPEFRVNISLTPPANGTYYVADEKPVVTVTLDKITYPVDSSGNPTYATPTYTPVDGSVYTTPASDPSSAKGVPGGGLSSAVLMVYGPRADALPVLTTDSTTDPGLASGAAPEQEHSLLSDSGDSRVSADANGFHYQLQAIPSTLDNGTYMVQAQIADYGGLSNSNYITGSTGLSYMQIGTATVEAKVDGNGCVNCHGDTRQHQTGKYAHDVPFNTDFCMACHDTSGGHGDPIANRVHAIHDANSQGDLTNYSNGKYVTPPSRDWSDINFPQKTSECVVCHTSSAATPSFTPAYDPSMVGDVSGWDPSNGTPAAADPATIVKGSDGYLTKPSEVPCFACHADDPGAIAHMQSNGGAYPK